MTEPTTKQLIGQAYARQDALAQVESLMAKATGTAHDLDGTIRLTVDARGKLLDLRLSPSAANWGPDRLGSLIVEVAQVAMQEATQAGYNQVALLLGEDMTYLIEQLSGAPAPARAANDDTGLTVEEFQRRRAERLGERRPHREERAEDPGDGYDLDTFDPASLRSDR
ncbi:YbaB/EbfC family nucleoid-associated protein [Prauserella cavernicola]|uniref:YbaB/EbfC family nucleoid-associated protein n=1 Tax=Prauserella cavernicola TaxID=2800127 RepID=A0A934V9D6_9PSEU|nr:YbaB/EbfC family nucleoid-associated protein [Prauserella cavernicola]MBK1789235.1 YbaB/EbfC family nucleoid-associated protein [Prauserella cavernicola]